MTTEVKIFVEDARAVTIADAAGRLGLAFRRSGAEHPQPCPVNGGKDRFSFNTSKNVWHCRCNGDGGQDAIGMAAHVLEHDLSTQTGLLEACAAVLGRPIPDEGERESDEERAERERRLADARAKASAEAERRERDQVDFREKERAKARGIYEAACALSGRDAASAYLRSRGCGVPDDRWLRHVAGLTYWHGRDERGQPASLHVGPAMVAPFIALTAAGLRAGHDDGRDGQWDHVAALPPSADKWDVIGCHITWIALAQPPKFRPWLADPATGETLPTKKMRGTKKGGLIPLAGDPAARRWLGAEGIENTLAFGRWEGFRADTFYFAAGDLGNMAGPADPKSRFAHPEMKKADKNGVERPVMIAGPVPMLRDGEADAMVVPDHVDELVLLADSDSERVMTAAAMVRAKARHARPKGQKPRLIPVVWPGPGTDFAAMMAGHDDAYEAGDAACEEDCKDGAARA